MRRLINNWGSRKKLPVGRERRTITISATLCPAIIVPFLNDPTSRDSSITFNVIALAIIMLG